MKALEGGQQLKQGQLQQLIPGGLRPEVYETDSFTVLDFETTNIDKGDCRNRNNEIVCLSYQYWKNKKLIVSRTTRGNEWDILADNQFFDCIEKSAFLVAHNSRFELGWLGRCGVDISKILFFCTQIAEYVIAGNRRWPLALNMVAEKRLGEKKGDLVSGMIKAGICPSIIPYKYLKKYCEKDVELTRRIFLQQLDELKELGLLPTMYTRCIATPVLADIESRGMKLDKAKVTKEHIEYERLHNSISSEISKFTGGINLNSPKQVAELLYERLGFSELKDRRGNPSRTATDRRKTDSGTIALLKANNKSQREFLRLFAEYGKIVAALSKNLRFFQAVVDEKDGGIFFANLNQTVTQTHRLSSTGKPTTFAAFGGKSKGMNLRAPKQVIV